MDRADADVPRSLVRQKLLTGALGMSPLEGGLLRVLSAICTAGVVGSYYALAGEERDCPETWSPDGPLPTGLQEREQKNLRAERRSLHLCVSHGCSVSDTP